MSSKHKDLSVKSLLEEAEVDETLNKLENPETHTEEEKPKEEEVELSKDQELKLLKSSDSATVQTKEETHDGPEDDSFVQLQAQV